MKLWQRVRIEIDPFDFCFQFPKAIQFIFSFFSIQAYACLFLVHSTEFDADLHLTRSAAE